MEYSNANKLRAMLFMIFMTFWWGGGTVGVLANIELEACTLAPHSVKGSDTEHPNTVEEDEMVICQLRTLHPDLDFDNLTASIPVPVERIPSLRLVCNDVLFFESLLTPDQLAGFRDLFHLTIDKCKVKFLPSESFRGLENLKNLTINTGNSDWAARSLDISPGAFQNVPLLRHLDLGFNHMWNIPERLLCQLENLQTLNLTHNLLSDIDDLGLPARAASQLEPTPIREYRSGGILGMGTSREFIGTGPPCLSELKSFDLSFNSLRSLGSRRLSGMKRLSELRLEQNWLEELDDGALWGLGGLKLLNLSSNRLVALPPKLFQPSKSIKILDLKNNSLSTLAPGLLQGLEHLVVLDLSMNSLTSQWITVEAFRGLVRLVILNLSNNQLTHLTPSTFHDLYTLQVLDLENNLISSIADSTFMPMSNLHSLNLGRNKLVTVSPKMLNGLYVLHKLILDYNQITGIEPGSMRNCTSLSDLGLVGNQLTQVPSALRGLQLLKTLDLGENRITTLTNESFHGMSQLYGLRLVDNKLEEIPKGVCDPITHLRVFNVAQNKISRVSASAFVACSELRVLRLDDNALDTLPPTLAPQLPKLLWLNVSDNQIRRADYSLLPASLEWFDVSHNHLESLGGAWGGSSGSPPHHHSTHNARLRIVEASHNRLTHLDLHAVPPALDRLALSHNRLVKIAPDTFSRSGRLLRVELIGNQLENVPLSALRFPPIPSDKPLPEFFIGGNPFLCDCEMEWLMRIQQLGGSRQYPVVLDLDAVVCRLSYSRAQTHMPLPAMKSSDFLCPYTAHCFQTCMCCDFDACDCAMTCPSNCTCYHGDTWTANVVDCAGSGHVAIPNSLPMDSTEVYLDGNSIPVLKSHSFIGRKNLRILYLNGSGIETISNKSFNSLQSLRVLHLEQNRLKRLHGYEFDHLSLLRELYLQDNRIETMSNTTFLPLKSLEVLRIDGNRLLVFSVWQLSLNPYLVEIGLGRNEWNCDCQFLHQLYGWVTDNSKKIVDLGQVQCVWNTTHEPGPHLLDYNTTCGTSWALIQGGFENFDLMSAFPLVIALGSVVVLIILTATLVFLCRENMRIWIFSRFGLRLGSRDLGSDKSYDAYFLYSQKDEDFVSRRVAEELETTENYRLCLHYRDLMGEAGELKEVMVGAADTSRSLVLFISRNFIQAEWTGGEYRAGFQALLKAAAKSAKPVLLVFIEDVPDAEVSPDLRAWMRASRRPRPSQLHWTDKKFWPKFKYALPDPSCHYHSNITSHTTTSSAASSERAGSGLKYYQDVEADDLRNHAATLSMSNKLWPYAAGNNFVALPPPKYGTTRPPPHYPQPQGHGVLTTLTRNHSPPSTSSTDSTSEGGGVGIGSSIPSFLFQPNAKSPVPMANFPRSQGQNQGESYLSLEGEHVYSTLDPPSPPSKNIQLPNGYTYHAPATQPQWHPHPPQQPRPSRDPYPKPTKKASGKDSSGGNTVQTYLV